MSNHIAFYVITTLCYHGKKTYKIGIHTGTLDDLLSRYATYFPDIIVMYFQYTNNAREVESKLKKNLTEYRITNIKGNLSEWIVMKYEKLFSLIKREINSDSDIIVDETCENRLFSKYVDKSISNKNQNTTENKIEQLIAIDLSKHKISELIQKQSSNKLNETEKLVLKKHFFMRDLGLNSKIKDKKLRELLNEYLDDRTAIRRYEILFGYHKETKKDNIFNEKEKAKISIIIDLVNRLIGKKYTKLTDNIFKNGSKQHIIIENKQYNKAISDIIDNSIYFKDEEKNRALFYSRPGRFKPATDKESRIAYAKRIQNLLNSYNINLKSFERKSKNGKRGFTYSLCVDEQIRDIVRNKYKSSLAVDDKHMKMLCNDYGN
ncbi:hypothetical protein [Acanthamoeba castellanii mimivirus]|uniref:Uncharacterized protein R10 n=5 Tax=Mimivirus TaxID=315393 RepID=YR010_MIMIV|nr:hypothetical protein MIMI_gp0010 [Acanthamoeba polyphaga mimivirus]Q5UP88.1 RecName: Full=Uncharacterized protein R10 [Acanthamoeba polyphaga mimivirus]AHA45890.1 hypothetical protein HIRU_S984 [Hirudovirus strain Sangsue]ALR83550.1 hypothetical protein [Niemeyer virus]AMK61702.1 hypothetical protein [Samba virus]AMZ02463.1 hypothetical protein [Mimivirus Bombay]BAV61078.1 hypothetical protein [Acanthamoeba castellanii mimivirus]